MSSVATVLTAAMELDRPERADVARKLIASLDDGGDAGEPEVETAWLAEVERRLATADAGTAQFEPWEVVEQRIVARLRDLHR